MNHILILKSTISAGMRIFLLGLHGNRRRTQRHRGSVLRSNKSGLGKGTLSGISQKLALK